MKNEEGGTMFDIDEFLTSTNLDVNATNIRFKDNRTGEVMNRTIFRPGKRINFQTLAKEMSQYGYTLMWIDDTPGDIPGKISWADLFGAFIQQEAAA